MGELLPDWIDGGAVLVAFLEATARQLSPLQPALVLGLGDGLRHLQDSSLRSLRLSTAPQGPPASPAGPAS